jgi:hypothetical protein
VRCYEAQRLLNAAAVHRSSCWSNVSNAVHNTCCNNWRPSTSASNCSVFDACSLSEQARINEEYKSTDSETVLTRWTVVSFAK